MPKSNPDREGMLKFFPLIGAIASAPSGAHSTDGPYFADLPANGDLIELEQSVIPERYRGLWALKPEECFNGDPIRITATTVFVSSISKVQHYRGHPAIRVSLRFQAKGVEEIVLDLSRNGRRLGVPAPHLGANMFLPLSRCPSNLSHAKERYWAKQLNDACRDGGNFPIFFDAFVASRRIQRRHLASRIKIAEPSGIRMLKKAEYGGIPFGKDGYDYILTDQGAVPSAIGLDIYRLLNGHQRVDMFQLIEADPGETTGHADNAKIIVGWLVFSRANDCWQLIEEGRQK
jgi:hypothetical protein